MEDKKDVYFAYIEPEEMASFLNDLAYEHFKDNPEIRQKLMQCSAFIHGCVFVMNNRASQKEEERLKGDICLK